MTYKNTLCIDAILSQVIATPGAAFFYSPNDKQGNCFWFTRCDRNFSFAQFTRREERPINQLLNDGYTGYALVEYEAGYTFEPKLFFREQRLRHHPFSFFFSSPENVRVGPPSEIDFSRAETSLARKRFRIGGFTLGTSKQEYIKNIRQIKEYIAAGETYQINYTLQAVYAFAGDILNYIYHLLFNQSAPYTAIINTGKTLIISLSPELFISIEGTSLTAKPMKGTIRRGKNLPEDVSRMQLLRSSPKERAENVMIVDLLRNDAGRISEAGSVSVPRLFDIEKYETLHQMTSTVCGRLTSPRLSGIFNAMFPCGSVTGAPKLRSMQIIRGLEKRNRGIYTGSIGLLTSEKKIFNVAIRTIEMNIKTGACAFGLGSGIVWDSKPADEYREVALKGGFALRPQRYFQLIETMLVENNRIFLETRHLRRLKNAAEYFLFHYDGMKIKGALRAYARGLESSGKYRLRLTLSKWGRVELSHASLHSLSAPVDIAISGKRVSSDDPFRYFKTTRRKLYDKEYLKAMNAGFFDVIFLNEYGNITEGAISNIAVKRKGTWVTPAVSEGLLAGVYREYLLEAGKMIEGLVTLLELLDAKEIIIFNSVRGIVSVKSVRITGNSNT